jgi:hypothetical protein
MAWIHVPWGNLSVANVRIHSNRTWLEGVKHNAADQASATKKGGFFGIECG